MTARPLLPSDIPILKALAANSGYPYPDPEDPSVEAVVVIVNDSNLPVGFFLAKRIIEGYLLLANMHPAAKLAAIRVMHEAAAPLLKAKGYDECNAFIPPELEKSFGKRLKMFGWGKNWGSWFKKL